ncbi:8409_t:CDS:1, partial [Cetraspora pellucida]
MCFYDNNGWSCTGSIATEINDINQPIGDCTLQLLLPNPSNTNSISPKQINTIRGAKSPEPTQSNTGSKYCGINVTNTNSYSDNSGGNTVYCNNSPGSIQTKDTFFRVFNFVV